MNSSTAYDVEMEGRERKIRRRVDFTIGLTFVAISLSYHFLPTLVDLLSLVGLLTLVVGAVLQHEKEESKK